MLFSDRIDASTLTVANGPTPIAQYQGIVFDLLDELGCALEP